MTIEKKAKCSNGYENMGKLFSQKRKILKVNFFLLSSFYLLNNREYIQNMRVSKCGTLWDQYLDRFVSKVVIVGDDFVDFVDMNLHTRVPRFK